jgi:hypothetical protein
MGSTQYFDRLNGIFGWGDPGSKKKPGIWFIGIEEGEGWPDEKKIQKQKNLKPAELTRAQKLQFAQEQIMELLGTRYSGGKVFAEETPETLKALDEDGARRWQGPRRVSQIVWKSSQRIEECRDHNHKEPWEYYKKEFLWLKGSAVCQANLYPIGRPNEKVWPEHYTELFGLTQKEWEREKTKICGLRFEALRRSWTDYQPQATICFGLSHVDDFKELFKGFEWDMPDENNIYRCKTEKILIVHHLSRIKLQVLDAIGAILRAWRVAIP